MSDELLNQQIIGGKHLVRQQSRGTGGDALTVIEKRSFNAPHELRAISGQVGSLAGGSSVANALDRGDDEDDDHRQNSRRCRWVRKV